MELVVFNCVLAETISTVARRVPVKRRAADSDAILQTLRACRDRDSRLLAGFDRDFDPVPWLTRVAQPEALS